MKIVDLQKGLSVLDVRRNLSILFILLTMIVSAGVFISLGNTWHNKPSVVFNKWYNISWYSVWIISGIFFSMWFYRAYSNLKLLGISKPKWDPYFAALSIWVPIANIYLPYAIMKELYTSSKVGDIQKGKVSRLPLVWWVTLILSVLLGWIALTHTSGHVTYSEFKTGIVLHILRYILFGFSGLILTKLIINISKYQQSSFQYIQSANESTE